MLLIMQENIKQQLLYVLNTAFHLREFRPGQLEALVTLVEHGRLLCIQPTGYGKSLLYQVPAVLLGGLTVVISPLLALMRDQLNQLENRFGISAASINSDQSDQENNAARKAAQTGNVRILFIAPEQLDGIDRINFFLRLPISLLVVDEAHCISTWGHDFRPSYRRIIKLARALVIKNPKLKLLGLTATANKKTEADIKQQLMVDKQNVMVQRESMDRPNIKLTIVHTTGTIAKLTNLIAVLNQLNGSGLIYCATRENTELVAEYLTSQGKQTIAYHAGIETKRKRKIQNDFLCDQYTLIAATNALGMGIDKPNLRFIIHFDFPASITAYYQEVGRAGRDGYPADGVLFYDPADKKIQQYFIDAGQPTFKDFQRILTTVLPADQTLTTLKQITGLHPTKLKVITAELVEQGFLRVISKNGVLNYQHTTKAGKPDLMRYDTQWRLRCSELEAIQRYAEQSGKCLMRTLRTALGDKKTKPCQQCSNCIGTRFRTNE